MKNVGNTTNIKTVFIIIAIVMIGLGFVLSFGAIVAMRFDFNKMNTILFRTNTYSIDNKFANIRINGAECSVRILPSNDALGKVVCQESDKIVHTVTVKDNTLMIERIDKRRWYEHFGVYWGHMEIEVYLPQSEFESLYVKNLSGDIVIPKEFHFESAEVQSTSGDIHFMAAVDGDLSAKTVSGELYLGEMLPQKLNIRSTSGDIAKCQTVTINTTSGEIEMSNVIADENIHIESVSGDVNLHQCDAASLWLKTVSGDVSGLLLTKKIFFVNTTSGDIDVPHLDSGGKCEVTTVSGDVEFDVK